MVKEKLTTFPPPCTSKKRLPAVQLSERMFSFASEGSVHTRRTTSNINLGQTGEKALHVQPTVFVLRETIRTASLMGEEDESFDWIKKNTSLAILTGGGGFLK